jgi:beta-mannosidase
MAQMPPVILNNDWYIDPKSYPFEWHSLQFPITLPGSVYQSLYTNHLIEHPFYADNHLKLGWVDSLDWTYQKTFTVSDDQLSQQHIDLVFDGVDTYADIFVNDQLIGHTNNMFRQWQFPVKTQLLAGANRLKVLIHAAKKYADSLAKQTLALRYPDNNRVFARKAQYQFGWDWGPVMIGAGIWKNVWLDAYNVTSNVELLQAKKDEKFHKLPRDLKLIQEKDAFGTSFYFEKSGSPLYMKGANWIPGSVYPGTMKRDEYRRWLLKAKEANMNMLRVWGGGYYEDDDFYDLCDSMGIYVWQDFMFACGMYPADSSFLQNVKKEVEYQVKRLRHHPCIALWCGNNESEEGWKNWGWQEQFNLHGDDSLKVWKAYQTLFEDSLRYWVNEFDGTRPYVSTSPKNGWGHKESFSEGDSHYWGLWWGLEDWEVFKEKTGRFVSEYGMQSMSHYATIYEYTPKSDLNMNSSTMKAHQRAGDGFKKLNHYLLRYFIDSAVLKKISLKDYTYLTQCMQSFVLYNSIITHRSQPKNMGTLLWQLNDCWPVTSWSIVDFFEHPKAAWFAVKRAYADEVKLNEDDFSKMNCIAAGKPIFKIKISGAHSISISSDRDAYYVEIDYPGGYRGDLSDNYFHLKKGETKEIFFNEIRVSESFLSYLSVKSLNQLYSKYRVK